MNTQTGRADDPTHGSQASQGARAAPSIYVTGVSYKNRTLSELAPSHRSWNLHVECGAPKLSDKNDVSPSVKYSGNLHSLPE